MRYGHLERVDVVLETLSPVFIGSGVQLTKKEYIFDKSSRKIHILDLAKFSEFLLKHSLVDAYEEYFTVPSKRNLLTFLSENGIEKKDYPAFVAYTVDAGEAATSERFMGIQMFIKGADGQPYIPGSSLKGLIHTAVAAKLVEKGDYEIIIQNIEKKAENPNPKVLPDSKQLESRLFCRLNIKDPRNPDMIRWDNIINNFMRGISVSDSGPIGFDMLTLCRKYDILPDGTENPKHIYRECLAPGTKAKFVMTLDRTITDKVGIDVDFIRNALVGVYKKQVESFDKYFASPKGGMKQDKEDDNYVILGGGAGYVSKTLTYPLIRDRGRAVKIVSNIMKKQFRKHEKDVWYYKVSPHTFKATKYNGEYYQMGKCRITFA